MSKQTQLRIIDLHATIENKPILRGVNLAMNTGEIHAIMGPNGSGKSTLANVILGHPFYEVTGGEVWFNDVNILELSTDERARLGLFLAFQYPVEIPGVTVAKFLKRSLEARIPPSNNGKKMAVSKFIKQLKVNMAFLDMDQHFVNRYLNEGFSGGEKKRMEILQMLTIKPKFAILDETDSGLDIDALKIVSKGVNKMRNTEFGALIITHYQRILNYIQPDHVHVLYNGRIVTSGGPEMVDELEEKGYDWIKEKFEEGIEVTA